MQCAKRFAEAYWVGHETYRQALVLQRVQPEAVHAQNP